MNFWQSLVSHLERERKVFLAIVAAHTKHSPGTTGAKMLVSENGETLGTIGGGKMEYEVVERAKEVLRTTEDFEPKIRVLHHTKSGKGEKSGMICAGSQTNLYCLCLPQRDAVTLAEVAQLHAKDRPAVLAISASGMAVLEQLEAPTKTELVQLEDGGWEYREQLFNQQRIAIFGGGHCSLALSRVMHQLGYEVFVYDTRSEVSTLAQNTFAREIKIVDDFQQAGRLICHPRFTHAIVMTADYPSDVRSLLGIAGMPLPFIGLMGSRAKIQKIFSDLRAAGISERFLASIHAPVGLPIPSHTPEEIAISIAAQILQQKQRISDERVTSL